MGIIYEGLDVEVKNDELYGVLVLEVNRILTYEDIKKLKEYIDEGRTDSWGEGYYSIDTPEGEVSMHFDINYPNYTDNIVIKQQALKEFYLSEQDEFSLQEPFNYEHLVNDTLYIPSFQSEWEFAKDNFIWLELLHNRRMLRLSLPVNDEQLNDALSKLKIDDWDYGTAKLKSKTLCLDEYISNREKFNILNKIVEISHKDKNEFRNFYLNLYKDK